MRIELDGRDAHRVGLPILGELCELEGCPRSLCEICLVIRRCNIGK
jgi:hypothetical protein